MAAKKESSFFNMVSTLLIVTLTAGITLGAVFILTEDPIEKAKKQKQEKAIKAVLDDFDRIESKNIKSAYDENQDLVFNVAYKGDQFVGVAIETFTNNGFGGTIKLMIGLSPDGTINNISVLEHKETPGLGDKMEKSKSDWSEQFNGKKGKVALKKNGGEIDAITAATISSNAFIDAVNRAIETFEQNKGGI
ncbi:MAG: RnfABCDGE type electron transport complex subunit G [Lentimicrobiaceae bacterium]|jgi:electron transport complex protein RnfG|nr:RnfABCDGE type electron transport complex subunit G [Lentimicrobiaceae bacterium]